MLGNSDHFSVLVCSLKVRNVFPPCRCSQYSDLGVQSGPNLTPLELWFSWTAYAKAQRILPAFLPSNNDRGNHSGFSGHHVSGNHGFSGFNGPIVKWYPLYHNNSRLNLAADRTKNYEWGRRCHFFIIFSLPAISFCFPFQTVYENTE